MKANFIIPIIISILLGGLCGKLVFDQYQKKEPVFDEKNSAYFLQQGVYSTKESMEKNTKNLPSKLVVLEEEKYYVYVGITKSQKNADKIKNTYKDLGFDLYQKEVIVNSNEFIQGLEQYDLLLDSAKKKEEIKSVSDVILASYEEILNKQ